MNRRTTRSADRDAVPALDFWTAGPADQEAATGPSMDGASADGPSRVRLNPENVRNGLAQLVLALVEALRELMERQAIRNDSRITSAL